MEKHSRMWASSQEVSLELASTSDKELYRTKGDNQLGERTQIWAHPANETMADLMAHAEVENLVVQLNESLELSSMEQRVKLVGAVLTTKAYEQIGSAEYPTKHMEGIRRSPDKLGTGEYFHHHYEG